MPHTTFPTLSECALCRSPQELQQSHLLPNFLFKRLREPTGSFVAASCPDWPIQRGPIAKMLCFDCEQLFSQWEGNVQRVFYPHDSRPNLPIKYGPWLQLFATSISWRALTFLKHSVQNPYITLSEAAQRLLPSLAPETHEAAEKVRCAWGRSLEASSAPVSQNDQHLIFLNGKNFPGERSGIVGFTVCHTDGATAVFSQLGPICILGVIEDHRPNDWKSTRVQSLGGKFHVTSQTLPGHFGAWLSSYFSTIREIETL